MYRITGGTLGCGNTTRFLVPHILTSFDVIWIQFGASSIVYLSLQWRVFSTVAYSQLNIITKSDKETVSQIVVKQEGRYTSHMAQKNLFNAVLVSSIISCYTTMHNSKDQSTFLHPHQPLFELRSSVYVMPQYWHLQNMFALFYRYTSCSFSSLSHSLYSVSSVFQLFSQSFNLIVVISFVRH